MSLQSKREKIAREATTAELVRSLELYDQTIPIERNGMQRASLKSRRDIVIAELSSRGIAQKLPARIERIVREWNQWSPAEQKRMDELVQEIISHCASGNGNRFVREWCERILSPKLAPFFQAQFPHTFRGNSDAS